MNFRRRIRDLPRRSGEPIAVRVVWELVTITRCRLGQGIGALPAIRAALAMRLLTKGVSAYRLAEYVTTLLSGC